LPDDVRIANLREVYARFPLEQLEARLEAIRRRLGGDRTNQALAALRAGDMEAACRLMLHYYDRTYRTALSGIPAERMTVYQYATCEPERIAADMLQAPGTQPSRRCRTIGVPPVASPYCDRRTTGETPVGQHRRDACAPPCGEPDAKSNSHIS
jgi:tRNA 2-selenouridine synthase